MATILLENSTTVLLLDIDAKHSPGQSRTLAECSDEVDDLTCVVIKPWPDIIIL